MAEHADHSPAGSQLGGYEISHLITGRGAGAVYRAVDIDSGLPVAIKEYLPAISERRDGEVQPWPDFAEDFGFGLRAFLTEAEAIASVDHSAIVPVLDIFEAHGTAYMVMPYFGGETLNDRIEGPARLDEAEIRSWLMPLLTGLGVLHKAGTLHLNLRPENVAFGNDGRPVLLGYSMTRIALRRRLRGDVTREVPDCYAALELNTENEPADYASDIYGLAALLYHAPGAVKAAASASWPRATIATLYCASSTRAWACISRTGR
jgi:non-specific serine/threonine protein kinase